ncbi:metal-dependent transcriptional regulator [Tengunoibacter tsumagoiensis]|uniref:DNA-binding protein n=1 Tax=Tengunoibacter tsumagoiensis TaxID=2014871 RepID=A0A401ZZL7_9CHLR|nr:metal-dependent transcriptional regulator [Tengunoibacter tsumagoiensis]GCE12251.1 DNA-binding protein [Tengunoibacter tsumagoiensis]
MKTDEMLSATVEEYLETIYNLSMENEVVIGARLAERFNVAPPTVTEMLKRLVRDGYIAMNQKRQVALTEAGYQAAEAVLRRHRLTERFLVDMLGMQWHEVHEEACRLEHFISGAVEARVIANLATPTTCPHGNPIPGLVPNARTYLQDHHAVRLSALSTGTAGTIFCISEVVEDEEALIFYLQQKGLTPGTQFTLLAQNCEETQTAEECIRLQVAGQDVFISLPVARKLWVTLRIA